MREEAISLSFQSLSFTPLKKKGALCFQAQAEVKLHSIKGLGVLTLEILNRDTSFITEMGAEAGVQLSK